MKYALITLALMASTGATVAVAQEGGSHGPPLAPVVVPTPTPQPAVPSQTTTPKSASAHDATSLNETGPVISTARESRKRGLRLA